VLSSMSSADSCCDGMKTLVRSRRSGAALPGMVARRTASATVWRCRSIPGGCIRAAAAAQPAEVP